MYIDRLHNNQEYMDLISLILKTQEMHFITEEFIRELSFYLLSICLLFLLIVLRLLLLLSEKVR